MTTTPGLPVRSSPEHQTAPTLISLRDADDLFDSLSSATARAILASLTDEPKPASALAEAVGTSTQNTMYHLRNLLEAGLITVVDTWYSEKGTKMTIYAARYDPLVLTTGSTA